MQAGDYPFFDDGFQAFAHRGGSWPGLGENSQAAFARAVAAGYTYLETDVHVTADKVVVAFHDSALDRVTDGHGLVAGRTWAELADVRIGGTAPIPRLADLFAQFPRARFNIDIKSADAVGPLAALIGEAGVQDRVCVSSFSPSRIGAFRRLVGSRVPTGLSRVGVLLAWVGPPLLLRFARAQAAQVPLRFGNDRVPLVTRRFVRTAHRNGIKVHVWTINDAATMNALIDLGVDGIVTDRPELLRSVLEQRGLWEA